ncbi:MAG: hypothetical protein QW702_04190 [Candidatus Bathyarchaeia archaeon]
MSRRPQRETKLVRVYGDLVVKLNEAANREGISFMEYINSVLEQALRAHKMGRSLRDIVDFYELMWMQREAGLIMVPYEVLNKIAERFYPSEKETLENIWYESGVWYGKYLLVKVKDGDPAEVFVETLKSAGWDIKDVVFERHGRNAVFKCFSLTLSLENTALLSKFIEGVMEAIGYEILNKSHLRGVIEIDLKRLEKNNK